MEEDSEALAEGVPQSMDAEEARRRFEEGGAIFTDGVPQGTEIGMDISIFTVGPRFRVRKGLHFHFFCNGAPFFLPFAMSFILCGCRVERESIRAGTTQGVKMAPPGLHLLVHGVGGGAEGRVGEFIKVEGRDVIIRRWDESAEAFHPGEGCDAGKADEIRRSVRTFFFDSEMAPYPSDNLATWQRMTTCLTEEVLQRCQIPPGRRIMPGDPDVKPEEERKDQAMLPFFSNVAVAPVFADVSLQRIEGMTPQEVTEFNRGEGGHRLKMVRQRLPLSLLLQYSFLRSKIEQRKRIVITIAGVVESV